MIDRLGRRGFLTLAWNAGIVAVFAGCRRAQARPRHGLPPPWDAGAVTPAVAELGERVHGDHPRLAGEVHATLVRAPVDRRREELGTIVVDETAGGSVVLVDGWIMSSHLAGFAALASA